MTTAAQTDRTEVGAGLVARLSHEAAQEGGYTSLAKAARIIGANAPSTAFRAAQKGVTLPDGTRVKLEAIRSGKKWLTTEAAVRRFLEAQQASPSMCGAPPRSPSARRRASEAAAAKADKLLA